MKLNSFERYTIIATLVFVAAMVFWYIGAETGNTDARGVETAISVLEPDYETSGENLIDINTAISQRLQTLEGIGPSLAQAIVEHREELGPFRAIEDIMDVPGIGQAKFDNIKDKITVGRGTIKNEDTGS